MTGEIRHLRKTLLAALIAVIVLMTAGCQSPAGPSSTPVVPGEVVKATSAPAATGPASDTKNCGTPPCMRFVSRGDTKTIATTIGAHPVITGLVIHAVGMLLCGGILCVLGEGISVVYVGHQAEAAAKNHECLRLRILPSGKEWHLVDISPSNQSPYCKD